MVGKSGPDSQIYYKTRRMGSVRAKIGQGNIQNIFLKTLTVMHRY